MEDLEELLARKQWARWLFGCICWVGIVLFFSTRLPRVGETTTWTQSLVASVSGWFVWALFVPAIIWCERKLRRFTEPLVNRLLLHVPISLAVTALSIYVNLALSLFLSGQLGSFSLSFEVLRTSWTGMFQSHLVIYWGILGLCIGWDSHTRMRDQQLRAAELERELLQARIGALRNQLHPHFLFNALNAISAHVEATPRTARRMLEELGGLLRLSLSHLEDPEISLEEEVEFIERYLGLQQARFGERLRVTIAIDPNAIGARVPTFLLEPLVENAIRHGVAPRSEPGHVEITVRKHRNRLRLQVADDGPGLPPGWNIEKGNGIGLRNTRDRLEYLYGVDQVFRVSGIEDSGVLVEIEIPCQSSVDVDEVRK